MEPARGLPGAEPYAPELAERLSAALAARGAGYQPRTHHLAEGGSPLFTNRLMLETSPYLLQHAHNPVNWFAWGDEAFAESRRLARPVFLSIGYSTCHWCHVMEEESFEDAEIATFLNTHYVAVKVDREERPDLDAVYMSAVQKLTGSGGWPMSVWLNAAREPFFGGTYFPPRDGARGARHGFLTILGELARTFQREPARVAEAARAIVEVVKQDMEGARGGGAEGEVPGRACIETAVTFYKRNFDRVHGGLRRAPKFPSNIPVRLLLRYHHRTGDAEALEMAVLTLRKMAAGGMYDQLGGGFHRYSTDAEWLVPHFEKMLYDNALLVPAYAEAYQVTKEAGLARVVRETCDYVLREMTDPVGGGFYSATDADSEGEEGRFFVWTDEEIRAVLGEGETTELFLRHYDVRPGGNWEGNTILNVPALDEAAWAVLKEARAKLYEVRAKRVPPLRDEKILTAWNGLMISGLAIAGRILNEPRYVAAAARAAEFVLTNLRGADGVLGRSFKEGRAPHAGFLDDHAFLAAGLLDLFEATAIAGEGGSDMRWFEEALKLAEETERAFADPAGGWFMTGAAHEALIARERPAYDGAEPSGTSVALMNAARLAVYTDDEKWRGVVMRALKAHATVLKERPIAMTEALLAVDFVQDDALEVVVVWPDAHPGAAKQELLEAVRATYVPSWAVVCGKEEAVVALARGIPFARHKLPMGSVTGYVCRRGRCELPDTSAASLAVHLLKKSSS